jgi:hypothetical protein
VSEYSIHNYSVVWWRLAKLAGHGYVVGRLVAGFMIQTPPRISSLVVVARHDVTGHAELP